MTPGIKPLVAGNWKMNGTKASLEVLEAIVQGYNSEMQRRISMLVCVPSTLLSLAANQTVGSQLRIGAQDCHQNKSGAHTGDVSAGMILDAGASSVIVGHSERRTDHGETNEIVKQKAEAALSAGLEVIVCIGETKVEREAGKTLEILGAQLEGSLPQGISASKTVVAYEPVWAIGTGLIPSIDDVVEAHAFIRDFLVENYGPTGDTVRILYGGSVKPENAVELMSVAHVDGALVGGASLKSEDFLGICAAYDNLA
ncbi:MAG: triose-phosphate isomerase [Pseudomonadota bacterium]